MAAKAFPLARGMGGKKRCGGKLPCKRQVRKRDRPSGYQCGRRRRYSDIQSYSAGWKDKFSEICSAVGRAEARRRLKPAPRLSIPAFLAHLFRDAP